MAMPSLTDDRQPQFDLPINQELTIMEDIVRGWQLLLDRIGRSGCGQRAPARHATTLLEISLSEGF